MKRRTTAAVVLVVASAACQTLLDFQSREPSDASRDAAAEPDARDAIAETSGDANDASACTHAPACDGGTCGPIVLASNLADPTHVVAQPLPCGGGTLAWLTDGCPADGGVGQVHLSDKDGGNVRTIGTPACGLDLAADAKFVFWAAYTSIELAPWDGFTTRTVATGGSMYLLGFAGGYVYWGGPYSNGVGRNGIEADRCGSTCEGFDVGASVTALGSGPDLYLTHTSSGATEDPGWVKRLTLDGGLETVATDQDFPHAVVVAAPWVFWAARDTIARAPLDGGAPTVIVSTHVNAMVSDGNALFWTSSDGNGEVRTSDFDGNARTLATDQKQPAGIAVDDMAVYWVDRGTDPLAMDGKLLKLAR